MYEVWRDSRLIGTPLIVPTQASATITIVHNESLAGGLGETGWANFTMVKVALAAGFIAANPPGKWVRVTMEFTAFPSGTTFTGLYFGQQGAGDAYDFTGNQVQLLFSGSGTLNGDGSTAWVSDWAQLGENFDETKNYVLAIQVTSDTGLSTLSRDLGAGHGGGGSYYKAGADAATTDKSGYTTDRSPNVMDTISKVEIADSHP